MKKPCLLLFMLLLLFCISVHAQEYKPTVVILYSDNLAGQQTVKDEAKKDFLSNLSCKLGSKFNVIIDGGYLEKLNNEGFNEPIRIEKDDLTAAFKNENVNFVVITHTINYATYGLYQRYIFSLKLIDIANNKYLFNGEFNLQRDTVGNKEALLYFFGETDKVVTKYLLKST